MRGLCIPVACQFCAGAPDTPDAPDAPDTLDAPGRLARPGTTDTGPPAPKLAAPKPPAPKPAGASCPVASESRSVMVTSVILPRRAAMVRVLTCTTRAMMVTSWPSTSSAKELSSPRGRYLRGKYSSISPTVCRSRCVEIALALGAGRYFLSGAFSMRSSEA